MNEEDAEKTGKKAMMDINAKIKELLQKEPDPRGGAAERTEHAQKLLKNEQIRLYILKNLRNKIGILKCCSGILEKDRDYAVYNDITHKEKILKSGKTKEIIINKDYYSLSKDIKYISSIDIRYYGPNCYTDSSGVTIQKTIKIKKIEEIEI